MSRSPMKKQPNDRKADREIRIISIEARLTATVCVTRICCAYLIISNGFYASILRWDEAIFAQVIDFSLWILV